MLLSEIIKRLKQTVSNISRLHDNNVRFRITGYQNTIKKIEHHFQSKYPNEYKNETYLKKNFETDQFSKEFENILTDHMIKVINEIIDGKRNPYKDAEKLSKEMVEIDDLIKIPGIGQAKAKELIKLGVHSRKDLKREKYLNLLTEHSKNYIIYQPLDRIPRDIITHFKNKFEKEYKGYSDFAGSYKRGSPTSGDIDIILIREELLNKSSIICYKDPKEALINKLPSFKILSPYMEGNDRVSTIFEYQDYYKDKNQSGKLYLKVDFFITNKKELPYAVLYVTGSRNFNIKMRQSAKKKGYVLNQKGLFKKEDDEQKKSIPAKTEKDIFDFLNVKYIEPSDRI